MVKIQEGRSMMTLAWIFLGIAVAGIGVQIHEFKKERSQYM